MKAALKPARPHSADSGKVTRRKGPDEPAAAKTRPNVSPPRNGRSTPRGPETGASADVQRPVQASWAGTVEVGAWDLDQVTERIFNAGILLSNALVSGAATSAIVGDAIGELDDAVRIIRSMALGARCQRPVLS